MIISRTPLRISFAGGGTDIKTFYKNEIGAVVSAAINQYVYITVHPCFYKKFLLHYSKMEIVDTVNEIKHPIIREALKLLKIKKGLEITCVADVPAGTGLGSSSSFTVGLLNALFAYKNKFVSQEMLAELACKIEIDILKEPIGKQDQYAAAFGNLNYIQFNPDESVFVRPIIMNPVLKRRLENNLIMFFTQKTRKAKKILTDQGKKADKNYQGLHYMRNQAVDLWRSFQLGELISIGYILRDGWKLKRNLARGISSEEIDKFYDIALKNGAVGGKICGAGGGGFLLFYAPKSRHKQIEKALRMKKFPFKFDKEGSKIIYYRE